MELSQAPPMDATEVFSARPTSSSADGLFPMASGLAIIVINSNNGNNRNTRNDSNNTSKNNNSNNHYNNKDNNSVVKHSWILESEPSSMKSSPAPVNGPICLLSIHYSIL